LSLLIIKSILNNSIRVVWGSIWICVLNLLPTHWTIFAPWLD
jgi:hypothetical protein